MQRHVKNYLIANGYTTADFIPCQYCEAQSQDIHHIKPRSQFGSKRKTEQDAPQNLIALCRTCHNKAHDNEISKETLFAIVQKALFNN